MAFFICLEGCDGVGKTTIRTKLIKAFIDLDLEIFAIGQHSWLNPWSSRLIIDIREQRKKHSVENVVQAYFNDKVAHADYNVKVNKQQDVNILADRFVISDAVYQEALYNIPAITTLEKHKNEGTLFPDLIIYVSVDEEEAYKRILGREKKMKHYERPASIKKIMHVYKQVLFKEKPEWFPPVIHFINDSSNIDQQIRDKLIPAILKYCKLDIHPDKHKKVKEGGS